MNQSKSEKPAAPARRNNRITLQMRLVLFILFIALIPLILISSRNIYQTQLALINGAKISLLSSAQQTANSLDTFFKETLNSLQIEGQFSAFFILFITRPSPATSKPGIRTRLGAS